MSEPGSRRLSPGRMAIFAFIVVAVVLGALNWGVELLEKLDLVETHRPDDYVQHLDEPLFERRGDWYETTSYAEGFLVPGRFRVEKGERFRVFVLGASFAMGTPYTVQTHGEERPGGISTWLREELQARFGPDGYEVINAAAGAQTSHRVRRIAEEVLQFDPDLIFVATCNNEGPPKPDYVKEQLHQLAAYRLMARLLAPSPEADERPVFTPQVLPPERVREEFRENLQAIIGAADNAGVTVAVATLPVNLRYGGDGAPLPPEDMAGRHREAECVAKGRELVQSGENAAALEALASCDDVPDAARWMGLAYANLGRLDEAREALELSVELLPRNRCRPSLNVATREEAGRSDSAILVDLEEAARATSPGELPGDDLFIDYCHLNWRGYASMARVLTSRLVEEGVLPERTTPQPTFEEYADEVGIDVTL